MKVKVVNTEEIGFTFYIILEIKRLYSKLLVLVGMRNTTSGFNENEIIKSLYPDI
jgi:hypothetical protein